MTREIARRLVGGVWETVVVEEGSGEWVTTQTTMDPTQFRAARTVPVELSPPPGAGKGILQAIVYVATASDFVGYAGGFTVALAVGHDVVSATVWKNNLPDLASVLADGPDSAYAVPLIVGETWSGPPTDLDDAGLYLLAETASPTGGSGDVKITASVLAVTL